MNHEARSIRMSPALRHGRNILCSEAAREFDELVEAHKYVRSPGSILKLVGESAGTLYFVISGWLAVSKSMADGHRQIIDVVLPGDFLNPGSADQKTSSVEIEPLTRAKFSALPRASWSRLLHHHPSLGLALDRSTGAAMARMSERMLRLGKGSAESRIAYAICELCLRSSAAGLVGDTRFHVPMTQLQLGDFTGLSAVHVCRTLRRLERKSVVEVADHMDIVIRDLDALISIAEIDPVELRKAIMP